MAGPRIKTLSKVLSSGNVAEFYTKSYGSNVVCYWTVKRTEGCCCTLAGRAVNSEQAFQQAEDRDATHVCSVEN